MAPRPRAIPAGRAGITIFPGEDWRDAKPQMIECVILPRLKSFVEGRRPSSQAADLRRDRVRLCFGVDGVAWDDEKVLERYELLYEAGLVQEYARDNGRRAGRTLWARR